MSADVALTFLLQTVKEVYTEHKNLKNGAQRELQQLIYDLGELQSLRKEAANKPDKSYIFKQKEEKMRKIAYEVEDAIEICLTKAAAAKTRSFWSRIRENMSTELEEKVKFLREQQVQPIINEMYEKFDITRKHQHESSSSFTKQQHQSIEQPFSQDQQDNIVDFQDEATIRRYLLEPKDELDVIAVSGIAGIGKTTFARKIFQHEEITDKFKLCIWIHVSEKFNSRDAFHHILKKVAPKEVLFANEEDLIISVRDSLKMSEFLLVMDDVWTEEDWKKIEKILPTKNGKGKVLVTTRDDDVAKAANIYREPHKLNVLGPEARLELLLLNVFRKVEDCSEDLKKVGRKIVERYGGVPLTILVVGGILRNTFKQDRGPADIEDEWLKVLNNADDLIAKDNGKLISRALELSYKRLSHDERACFLYTGLFPEKHEIPVSTLKQLWIAEGFLQQDGRLSLEKRADEILKKLINMNLLMVPKKNLKQVKRCWVHDMIRGFCRDKALDENLFRVIQKKDEGPSELPVFRRLCFDSDPSRFLSGDLKDARVRSFLCFSKEIVDQGQTSISTFPADLNVIRVLNCKSVKFQRFPEVKRLTLLKHVTLFIENLKILPEEISILVNLEALIVDTNLDSIMVKVNIWKMVRLMRLETKAVILLDGKIWKSKACGKLQTISRLSPESCKPALSKKASNLKELGVRGKVANLVQAISLGDFEELEKLKLVNDVGQELSPSKNPLLIKEPDCFPPNLKNLTLSGTYLEWHVHMPLLSKIEKLEFLKLKDNAFVGANWFADVGVFPELRFLLVKELGLVKWAASDSQFPKLKSLEIKNCQQLRAIPYALKSLANLEIEHVSELVVKSARAIALEQTRKFQKSKWEIPFYLTIGPGCGQALFSGKINADDFAA